jgi:hypothetical protein
MMGFAGAALARWIGEGGYRLAALAALGIALGLPAGLDMIAGNVAGDPSPQARTFAAAPALWNAVRRHASEGERVANNPQYLDGVTPWPVNISWALLADRRSCYAGRELALPFAPVPAARRAAIDAQFVRVFAGQPAAGDVADFAGRYNCDVVVVTPQDGAWGRDPFATAGEYRLVEEKPDAWRIYRKATLR